MHKQGILSAAVLLFSIFVSVVMLVGCAGSQASPTQPKDLSTNLGNPIMEHTQALQQAIKYRSCDNVKTLLNSGYVDIYTRLFLFYAGDHGPAGQMVIMQWLTSGERKKYSKEIEEQEFCILNEYKRRGFNFAEKFPDTIAGPGSGYGEGTSLADVFAWQIVFLNICRRSDHGSCGPASELSTLHPPVTKRSVSYVIQTSDKEAIFNSFDTVCRAGLRSDQQGFQRTYDVRVRDVLREAGARVPESCTTF